MQGTLGFAFLTVLGLSSLGQSVVLTKCDLAKRLKLHGASNVEEWTCIADVNTNGEFDTEWKNNINDGFGMWEISAREWCQHQSVLGGPNRCNFDCERFQDGFLTDDLRCLNEIYAARGFHGFPGWYRRFRKCPNLVTYLQDCPNL